MSSLEMINMRLAPYAGFLALAMVTFLVLFIVYAVSLSNEKKKIPAPVPEWSAASITTAPSATLTASNTLNAVLVANPAAIATYTSPTAAALVAAVNLVKEAKNDQTFRFIIVNRSAYVVTFAGGTGVTVTGAQAAVPATDYTIFSVTLTNVAAGSEAVAITQLSTGVLT